ncbi:MAG: molecular chaperone, partial [Geminicoccaceae bacterium]
MTDSASVDDARQIEKTAGVVSRWNAEIRAYQKTAKDWKKDVKTNFERYSLRDKQSDPAVEPDQRFNILWSNTQTAAPAVFSQVPVPAIERRHRDKDLVGRVASQVLERAVATDMEFDDLDVTGRDIRLDFLLAARSVTWVRYDPTIIENEVAVVAVEEGGFVDGDGNSFDEAEEDEDGFVVRSEQVTRERAPVDYVHWSDFAHKPVKSWKELQRDGWVARRSFLTQRQVVERFGEEFRDVPLTATPRGMEQEDKSNPDKAPIEKLAEVWEIWDVRAREAIWIATKFTEKPLDRRDDPLGLEEFFPCPRPAYGTLTTDSLIPIPDYQQYQALAEELDDLTERIATLQDALKVVGVYDSSLEGLGTLLTKGNRDNRMVPVSNMAAYLGKGATGAKLQNVIQFFPLEVVVQALISLYEARDRTKQTLFEISGLADIIRGQVDPREKLGQSRIKGQFATLRLDDKQD